MKRGHASRLWIWALGCWLLVSCASLGGSSSCGGLTMPIPSGPFPEAQKSDNVANLRLSQAGINFLNANWQGLLKGLLPDAGTGQYPTLSIPIGCRNLAGVYFADQGKPAADGTPCASTTCGRSDEFCDPNPSSPTYDAPETVTASITNFSLVPDSASDTLQITVALKVDTGNIYVDTACIHCDVDFNNTDAGAGQNQMQVTLQFSVDTKWNNLVDMKVLQLDGTQVCGSSGAPAAPECLDPNALHITGVSGTPSNCNFVCSIAQSFTSNFLGYLSPFLQDAIMNIVNQQTCEQCLLPSDPPCPTGSFCSTNGACIDNTDSSHCVPRALGIEGRATLAAFLTNFGVPPDAQLDVSLDLGSSADVNNGLNLGMRGGVLAAAQNECVPPMGSSTLPTVPTPNFDRDAPDGGAGYHLAIGLSQPFLSQALFQAQQSGALCLNLGTAQFGLISTGLFKTFLPSLGKLATRDGKDAPMMVSLRPASPPSITLGAGTYDPVTKKAIDPLLTLSMPNLSIDFYAQVDNRLARLFTLTADVKLPLSLIINGCASLEPAFGDFQSLITNVRTSNAELLAEDPSLLGDLVPLALGIAEPAIGSLIQPISLPPFGNFQLQVNGIKGINANPTGGYYHLGIYGTLVGSGVSCAEAAPAITARLARSEIPSAAEMRLTGKPLTWPAAVLAVTATGPGETEYAWRVDDGPWSDFFPPQDDGTIRVAHPAFLLQGAHNIDVRSRSALLPRGISSPVRVGFVVDWDPPEVHLTADRANNRIQVDARDVISAPGELQYAYRVGDGATSEFGAAREIDLASVEQQGGVEVFVRDAAGNIGKASWGTSAIVTHAPTANLAGPQTGCSAGGVDLLSLLALAGLFSRRRSRS